MLSDSTLIWQLSLALVTPNCDPDPSLTHHAAFLCPAPTPKSAAPAPTPLTTLPGPTPPAPTLPALTPPVPTPPALTPPVHTLPAPTPPVLTLPAPTPPAALFWSYHIICQTPAGCHCLRKVYVWLEPPMENTDFLKVIFIALAKCLDKRICAGKCARKAKKTVQLASQRDKMTTFWLWSHPTSRDSLTTPIFREG